jgi:hypothetical protein
MFRRICLAAVLISSFCGGGQYVQAATTNFGVKAQLPANQIDTSVHYYDLLVSPNTTQTLKLQVQNTGTGTQRFKISTNRAGTTSDGQLNFNQHGVTRPKSLTYNIESLMPKPKIISIAPRTTRTVSLKLTAPKANWSGVLLGAVHVTQLDTTTRVAYNIGLQLRASKTLPAQVPQLQFNGVDTKISATGDSVKALLENPASRIQTGLNVRAQVFRLKNRREVMHHQVKNATLAPNSVMAFTANKYTKRLASGKYQLIVDATNGKQAWHFIKNFTVTQPVIKTTPTPANPAQKFHQLPAWVIIFLITIVVALVSLIYWLVAKRRNDS